MKNIGLWALCGVLALSAASFVASNAVPADAKQASGAKPARSVTASYPVVLELFTSQGCSSCPPADKLAAQLAKDPSLVVITRPVTYWDRLGWKDTLAKESNTALQRSYARKGNEGAGVYTPQIVVDGRHGAVGSNRRNVSALIRSAAMKDKPTLRTTRGSDGGVRVSISGKFTGRSELSLLALSSHESVSISRGENGGRTVSYTNVLIDETQIAQPNRTGQSFSIPATKLKKAAADRYAIILRRPNSGAILAGEILR